MKISEGVAWDETGFQFEIDRITGSSDRFIKISDLNPEAVIRFRATRFECLKLGFLIVWRAISAHTPLEQHLAKENLKTRYFTSD